MSGKQISQPVPVKASSAAIDIRGLKKSYPGQLRPAVDHIDLKIPAGMLFGLLGPNGAGKTTILSLLCGTAKPDGGVIDYFGHGSGNGLQFKQLLGFVPQDLALYDQLSGRENLSFFGRLYGMGGHRLRERVGYGLHLSGLETRAEQKVATYSGGMKRRLNLAAGILHEPRIICLDEPTVGIDAQSRQLIHEQLICMADRGTTIVYTTHYLEEAERLCRQVAIIDEGRILACGSPRELTQGGGHASLGELFFALTGKELRD